MSCKPLARLLLAFVLGSAAAHADTTVFAAASLTDVLDTIAETYGRTHAEHVRLSYASTSVLAKQIELGAGADVFVSADQDWMDYLVQRGLTKDKPVVVARNALVLIAPLDFPLSTVHLDRQTDFLALLGGQRLAMGDPAHVPAGKYGKAALNALGLWPTVESRVLPLDNVRVALAVVERGEAPLGVVYATDARISSRVKTVAVFPATSHAPIEYPAVQLKNGAGNDAATFLAFLQSPEAREIFRAQGFTVDPTP